jgi:hypothetical protein
MWLRLRQVALVAEELAPVLDDLEAVFGLAVAFRDPGVKRFGLENAVIPVGRQFLEVVAPIEEGTTAGRYLERRKGAGGYMVITHTDDHARRKARVAELGIRTVLDFDDHGYTCMQLHPRDTGGSFLEIDRQEGGEDLDGPWHPAGPSWQEAIRTDVVDGITAVEVQSDDPAALAARWSEIVEIPVEGDAPPVLRLDNAAVHFVPDADGRGEGLSAVHLSAVDAAAARSAAEERGLLGPDGSIAICGMRFLVS